MAEIQFDAGTLLAADDGNYELTYALVPHGERCRSNLGEFAVDTGAFSIPEDLTGMAVNLDHKREQPVAAFKQLKDQADTMLATFKFANTKEGRDAYADAKNPNGKRRHVSVEARDVVIKAGKAISGRVFGAALVESPAFPSATLLAAAADTPVVPDTEEAPAEEPASTTEHTENEFVDENGVTWHRVEDVETKTEAAPDGSEKTTTTTTVVEETTPGEVPATPEEDAVGVPNTLNAGKAPVTTEQRPVDLRNLFAAMNRAKVRQATNEDMTLLASTSTLLGGAPEQIASTLTAALSDVKISGTNSLPVGGAAIQPNWVGQLNQGIGYERIYVPLAKTGTDITAEGKKGYKVHRGTSASPVDSYASTGEWAGNKAAIGSGTGFTDPFTSTLHRFAFGDDIAREFVDLPGGAEVLATYFSLIKEDHLVWSDEWARLAWIALAGNPIAVSAAIPATYPTALGIVMQAIRAVNKAKADKRRDKATFVIVNDEAAEAIDFTPFEHIPEFLKFSWNLDHSDLKAGDVILVNGDNGITGSPAALAGADYALELDELAGGPLWIDALNIAQGGIDRAIHGYLQEFQVRPEAVKVVGTPQDRANTTAYPAGRLIKAGAVVYRVTIAGTSGASAPTAPSVGATVADGTATLLRLV
jgi:hypothetical protein